MPRTDAPPEIHWDPLAWSWRWDCIVPGCHEGGAGFESRDGARAVGQAHADVHDVRRSW